MTAPVSPHDAAMLLARYRDNPVAFVREILGGEPWEAQEAVLRSVVENKRTAVASGHGVGKTWIASACALHFAFTRPRSRVLVLGPSLQSTLLKAWPEITALHRHAKVPLGGVVQADRLLVDGTLGWSIQCLNPAQPDSAQGVHATDVLVVFDEGQGIAPGMYAAAESLMSPAGARWLAIGNPLVSSGPYHDCFHSKRDMWSCHHVSCLDHPNVVAELAGKPRPFPGAVSLGWVREFEASWGRGAPFKSRVEGQFAHSEDEVLIPLSLMDATSDLDRPEVEVEQLAGVHVGCDPARFGRDETVCVVVADGVVVDVQRWAGKSTMETCGRLLDIATRVGAPDENVHVDNIGLGASIEDRAHELGRNIDGVCVAAAPTDGWRSLLGSMVVANRRAELYAACRALIERRALIIPRKFDRIWSELVSVRPAFDSRGRLLIEAKDAIRERIGRSPDSADSLILALAGARYSGPLFRLLDRDDVLFGGRGGRHADPLFGSNRGWRPW